MGLFGRKSKDVEPSKTALEAAADGQKHGAVDKLIDTVLSVGIDGRGPLPSATALAEAVRKRTDTDEAAVKRVIKLSTRRGAVGGFLTGLGGFVTMPVALPVNVIEFYVQAVRMVAATAHLRGYDVTEPQVRTAILLSLVGSDADEVLRHAGVAPVGGRLASFALRRFPPAVLMVVNKGIGFRLLRGLGEKAVARLGKGVPFAGGVIGGALDAWMMSRIGKHARTEFPPLDQSIKP